MALILRKKGQHFGNFDLNGWKRLLRIRNIVGKNDNKDNEMTEYSIDSILY